jgi:hypothetical protein
MQEEQFWFGLQGSVTRATSAKAKALTSEKTDSKSHLPPVLAHLDIDRTVELSTFIAASIEAGAASPPAPK